MAESEEIQELKSIYQHRKQRENSGVNSEETAG